jgi:hypothetical protein
VKVVGAALVPLQVASKLGSRISELPAGIVAFEDRFVTVTTLPDCEKFPFQPNVIVCPFANENRRVQPLIATLPVLVIVKIVSKPPAHWLTTP